ncbi:DEAD/DEAH box helicase [Luteirhabdus pelagi]|uniref:DEAD/DEAH box helicase n=1 Tax=Luteirhabdus pelagi TaxID=2792783 RepID=UPI001939C7CA|nr:DEAD/DEAH box helicase [Luteirhabdus pelagi]
MYDYYDSNEVISVLEELKTKKALPNGSFKKLLESTYYFLQTKSENKNLYNLSLSVICHTAEYLPEDKLLEDLLFECISASRVFLYRDMLESKFPEISNKPSIYENFARAFYTMDTTTTLTKEQKELFNFFQENRRIVVSAPTSFGKSRIITEIINHNNYSNIAIVLPTIALLSETFIRFRKDNLIFQKYNIVNTLQQPLRDHHNLLIFTPEKIDTFMDENPKFPIDFFVMDEIYKIQDDGERSKIFTNALYRLTKKKSDFYLIGPYFDKFSEKFLEYNNAKFIKFDAEVVQKDFIDLTEFDKKEKVTVGNVEIKNGGKETNLKNILKGSDEQALVYVGDKRGVESKAKWIAKHEEDVKDKSGLIAYLETTFSKDWSLVECLKKGVAFHHAGIPKFIQIEIVDTFNKSNGDINTIVCSPTLIEGVNTAAKQVIIFDNAKGIDLLTDFDVKNINGRAGRFLQHFIGRSISLIKLPKEDGEKIIEFSFYDKPLDNEDVIQVNREDLKDKNLERRNELEGYLQRESVPLALIKSNKFIPVSSQINLINHFRKNSFFFEEFQFLTQPNKEQFEKILRLIHEFLFVKKYKEDKSFLISDIIFNAKGYVYFNLSLKQIIEQQRRKSIDAKIRTALTLITRYFEFALPRYLMVFQNLFNFVCEEMDQPLKKINLELLIIKLEYGVTESHEIALKEAGLPNIIVKTIGDKFKGCKDINDIRALYLDNPELIKSLHPYEQQIFTKHI